MCLTLQSGFRPTGAHLLSDLSSCISVSNLHGRQHEALKSMNERPFNNTGVRMDSLRRVMAFSARSDRLAIPLIVLFCVLGGRGSMPAP